MQEVISWDSDEILKGMAVPGTYHHGTHWYFVMCAL